MAVPVRPPPRGASVSSATGRFVRTENMRAHTRDISREAAMAGQLVLVGTGSRWPWLEMRRREAALFDGDHRQTRRRGGGSRGRWPWLGRIWSLRGDGHGGQAHARRHGLEAGMAADEAAGGGRGRRRPRADEEARRSEQGTAATAREDLDLEGRIWILRWPWRASSGSGGWRRGEGPRSGRCVARRPGGARARGRACRGGGGVERRRL